MKLVSGGKFVMGSETFYDDERPMRVESVESFWIDTTPVTNERFEKFVTETGYITIAEKVPTPEDYPGLLPEMAYAGSLVFIPPSGPVDLHLPPEWWHFVSGANWRQPTGVGSNIDDKMTHPVVHIAYPDAKAYADWAGKELPTEAEWEYACRAGLPYSDYAWGNELEPEGQMMANYWRGRFPDNRLPVKGFKTTTPVGLFPPNRHGLYDMIGNVWEWTSDWYETRPISKSKTKSCCTEQPVETGNNIRSEPSQHDLTMKHKVLKGGSFMCSPDYCQRYRPAAKIALTQDTSACHAGFRCIIRIKDN